MGEPSQSTFERLIEEFKDVYRNGIVRPFPAQTDGLIILTGDGHPPVENLTRIHYGAKLFQELNQAVPFIFSGVSEEKEHAVDLILRAGIPRNLIFFQDCGSRGRANTKTQFETISAAESTRRLKRLVIVTSTYHVPRVRRTARQILSSDVMVTITADPEDYKTYNAFFKVMDEIDRIINYANRGDIALYWP